MRLLFVLFAALALAGACGDDSDSPPDTSGTPARTGCPKFAPLSPDTHTIRIQKAAGTTATLIIQLADNNAERGTGLSNRECLPEDSGMLFAFPSDTTTTFQMRDTTIPLTIAFIQADGEIVDILDMQPNASESYASAVPYRYAIEVAQGWFAEQGVALGDIAQIDEVLSLNAQ